MRRTRFFAGAALALVAACGGSGGYTTSSMTGGGGGGGGGGGAGSSTLTPVMSGTAFSPILDSIAVGSTVTWTNNDPITHTVTYASGPDASYDSGNIGSGGTFQHTFASAGTYVYYCQIHGSPTGGMRGTIVVH